MVRFLRSWQGIALVIVIAAAAAGTAWWLTRPPRVIDPLEALREKGAILVGVRTSAPPFSAADKDLGFVGYEPDIARALASKLGVKADFVAVDDVNAHDFLKRGVVDILILPRVGIEPRDAQIRIIEPGYFASGFNALALREGAPRSWESLKGESVCGLQSSAPSKQIVEELGGSFIGFADRNTALQALTAERCRAFINDEVALRGALLSDVDRRFTMAFETIDVAPWTISVRAEDAALAEFAGKALADLHGSGFLIGQAKTWKLPRNPYLESMQKNYRQEM